MSDVSHHDRLIHKLGHPITRLLLSPRLRRLPLATSAYAQLYLLGKSLTESGQRRLLRGRLEPGMVVFDVGANIGFYTTFFAALVGPAGEVHAFEPDPVSFEILRRRAGRLDNVRTSQVAAGDRAGRATLFCNRANRADNRLYPHPGEVETFEVPQTTLDDYCESRGIQRIDGLKMDVQGAEVAVLKGFRRTLRRMPPRWMVIELAPELLVGAGASPQAFWEILTEHGFVPHRAAGGELIPIADTAAFTREHARGYTDVWALRG